VVNSEQNLHGATSTSFGPHPTAARVVVVLAHGRGSDGPSIIAETHDISDATDVCWLAPTATDGQWYPESFMAPIEANQPWFDHTIDRFASLLDRLEADGIDDGEVVLLGFSQGACVVSEIARRRPRAYAGVVILSGGFVGPPDQIWTLPAGLENVPVFIGCSDDDEWIPERRVHDTAGVFHSAGAAVDYRIYEAMGHVISDDERDAVRAIVDAVR
jgi:phospholipase/carboxylesterase